MGVDAAKRAPHWPVITPGDLARYARGPAAEAWVLLTELFLVHGRPRFFSVGQELELSPSQSVVLRLLDEPRAMGELAGLMRCDNSNMTGIVDRLSERGLVERRAAANDRRIRLIALTEAGRELRTELARRLAQAPEALTTLSAADQRALRDILARAIGR